MKLLQHMNKATSAVAVFGLAGPSVAGPLDASDTFYSVYGLIVNGGTC